MPAFDHSNSLRHIFEGEPAANASGLQALSGHARECYTGESPGQVCRPEVGILKSNL